MSSGRIETCPVFFCGFKLMTLGNLCLKYSEQSHTRIKMLRHIVDGVFFIDQGSKFERDQSFEYLCPINFLSKNASLDDYFGPPDLGTVFAFCQSLEQRHWGSCGQLAIMASTDRRLYTSTVFLVGAYIIMRLHKELDIAMQCLDPFMSTTINFHNDAVVHTDAHLRLRDCLGALHRAKQIGWVDFAPNRFDVDEYRQLDSPLNADLHEVVPGKIIMMRGPRDLPGGMPWRDVTNDDGRFCRREFSPAHYVEILEQLDVRAVVRCSMSAYDSEGFESAGIAVVDLCCEDGVAPPIDVVSKFLAVAESLPGALAVHCGSGRMRSGTLVALYLMKHHGFTAWEAIGWLRIVRPRW